MRFSSSIRSCSCSCSEHLCLKHLLKGLGLDWLATLALIRLCTGAQQCHVQISKSLCKIIDMRAINFKHIYGNVLVHHCMFANKWGCHGSKIIIQIARSKSLLGFACRLWVTQSPTACVENAYTLCGIYECALATPKALRDKYIWTDHWWS